MLRSFVLARLDESGKSFHGHPEVTRRNRLILYAAELG